MHVIYFFIVLAIINIAMFLLVTQCLGYYKNKSKNIKGIIIISSCFIFTIISALVYSGMVGWNCKENYEWELNQGFRVSPLRQQCMNEGVCRNSKNSSKNLPGILVGSTEKNTCTAPTQINMTTLNFPPRLSKNCRANFDSEDYGSGCNKVTVGWNGNPSSPMTVSNWINGPDSTQSFGWARPDATSNSGGYITPTASCTNNQTRPQPPNINYSMPWNMYSTLHNYGKPVSIPIKLPLPGASPAFNIGGCCAENKTTKENYTPLFLNCSNKQNIKFS